MTVARPVADDLPGVVIGVEPMRAPDGIPVVVMQVVREGVPAAVSILDPEAARTLAASLVEAADRAERFIYGQFPAADEGWPQ
ncbi:hypothetical protein [Bosea vestrisii]|uniref:Uncharacterized protein n=1 Tax=Bosea vestrisii TaxID=151416 RepID=A0ABW0H1Y9_9HYPH